VCLGSRDSGRLGITRTRCANRCGASWDVDRSNFAARRPSAMVAWLRRQSVRDRLHRAFERDHDTPWADDPARAYDLVRV
jgi:hypothetical protein